MYIEFFSSPSYYLRRLDSIFGYLVDLAVREVFHCRVGLPLVFKSSFDKANRTSSKSFRGPGMVEGLKVFMIVKILFMHFVLQNFGSCSDRMSHCNKVSFFLIIGDRS